LFVPFGAIKSEVGSRVPTSLSQIHSTIARSLTAPTAELIPPEVWWADVTTISTVGEHLLDAANLTLDLAQPSSQISQHIF